MIPVRARMGRPAHARATFIAREGRTPCGRSPTRTRQRPRITKIRDVYGIPSFSSRAEKTKKSRRRLDIGQIYPVSRVERHACAWRSRTTRESLPSRTIGTTITRLRTCTTPIIRICPWRRRPSLSHTSSPHISLSCSRSCSRSCPLLSLSLMLSLCLCDFNNNLSVWRHPVMMCPMMCPVCSLAC